MLGRRLADQGGRRYTARLGSRYGPMGVSPRVTEYPSNRPALTTLPVERRNFRLSVIAGMCVDRPVSRTPLGLSVNRRFASTMTANGRIPGQHARSLRNFGGQLRVYDSLAQRGVARR